MTEKDNKEVVITQQLYQKLQDDIQIVVDKLSSEEYTDEQKKQMIKQVTGIFSAYEVSMSQVMSKTLEKSFKQAVYEADMILSKEMDDKDFKPSKDIDGMPYIEAVNESVLDLRACIRTALGNGIKGIDDILNKTAELIDDGIITGATRKNMVKAMYKEFENKGFTAFVTKDGKHLPLDVYTEVVVITKKKQVVNHAKLDRFKDAGVNTFKVTGSVPTCGKCSIYRGRVFTMDASDKRFTYLDPYITFPVHPRCQCVISPYVTEYKTDDEIKRESENSKTFDLTKDERTKQHQKEYNERQRAIAKARKDAKDYEIMQVVLKGEAPKSIGAFRRMKNYNPDKYNELMRKMRSTETYKQIRNMPRAKLGKVPENVIDHFTSLRK